MEALKKQQQQQHMECQVAVVGAGVMGLSAALHLARMGKDTLLVDQFPRLHSNGSSGGRSRAIRQANQGHPALTSIMSAARNAWKNLEVEGGTQLYVPKSMVTLGNSEDSFSMEQMHRCAVAIEEATGEPPDWPSIDEANHMLGSRFPSHYVAQMDTTAGVLRADQCLKTLLKLFQSSGGRMVDNWDVKKIIPGKPVILYGEKGTIIADAVVLCPGVWAEKVLRPLQVNLPKLKLERICLEYWQTVEPDKAPPYVFIDLSNTSHPYYSLPPVEYPDLVKMVYHGGVVLNNVNEIEEVDLQSERDRSREYVKRFFPGLNPQSVREEYCLYTTTPDKEFIVDYHPRHNNIVYGVGFSGMGFKVGPVVGQTLAEMVTGNPTSLDFSAFSLARFGSKI
ncbi:unnamed protein product [Meganyctiphanes norvegica]|uniref:FAD dependent oxidoreductase domain-containing protein n=1 Tax=Meganyctiphanes norvegica TaxID=48144 RepID=A0AAV2Q0K9_MEGNR